VHFCICDVFCNGLTSECWIPMNDFHGLGGTSRDDVASLQECQTACINDRTCMAIDWETENGQRVCWIITTPYILPTTDLGVIIHYLLLRDCLS